MSMTYKDAKAYLQTVADSTPLAGYGAALSAAIRALDEVEAQGRMIEQLKKDLLEADDAWGCKFCIHSKETIPCEGYDYICDDCPRPGCVCHNCVKGSEWEWRGVVEDNRIESDTVKLVEIDQFAEVEHE